ncbi:hypothetical protein FB45DRAFT_896590 [Roridomyces roridus]|uniref:Uncharacterized protein n=1 Tax=Roridomyces roridus TaxID=1738132 RepID=A0AAD7CAX9_9AGAR|nr:hypothetical protein FB45DRAFT_896590 [Roridomyces roridus]
MYGWLIALVLTVGIAGDVAFHSARRACLPGPRLPVTQLELQFFRRRVVLVLYLCFSAPALVSDLVCSRPWHINTSWAIFLAMRRVGWGSRR